MTANRTVNESRFLMVLFFKQNYIVVHLFRLRLIELKATPDWWSDPSDKLLVGNALRKCVCVLAVTLQRCHAPPLVQIVGFPQLDLSVVSGRGQDRTSHVPTSSPDRGCVIVVTASQSYL